MNAMLTLSCPTCATTSEVPRDAAGYQCRSCQQMWLIRRCRHCSELQHVQADHESRWACLTCSVINEGHTRPATADARRNGAAATVGVGALIAVAGTFAAWGTATAGAFTASKSGLDYSGDAKWVIGLAAVAGLSALAEVTGWRILPWLTRSVIFDGLLMIAFCGYAMSQTSRTETVGSGGFTLTVHRQIGAGLWLSMAGAALVLVGGYTLAGGMRQSLRSLTAGGLRELGERAR